MNNDLMPLLRLMLVGDHAASEKIFLSFKQQTLTLVQQEQIHFFLKSQKIHHAIYLRGLLYEYGYGVKQDYDMSFLLMREAAAKGNSYATYEVGHHLLEGLGVEKHYESAVEWIQLAAGSPHYVPDAMYDLGRMYENAWGLTIDLNKAKSWYENAARKGHQGAKEALVRLGLA